MAVLHKKEEKIQAVLGRLPKKYSHEQFIEMFIKLYSKDWGKIKSAYIKQSQDKEPGTVINMPKPEIYLKQILANYLQQADEPKAAVKEVIVVEKPVVTAKKETQVEVAVAKPKPSKKKAEAEESIEAPKKAKTAVKKKAEVDEVNEEAPKKVKAPAKKKTEIADEKPKATKKVAVKK